MRFLPTFASVTGSNRIPNLVPSVGTRPTSSPAHRRCPSAAPRPRTARDGVDRSHRSRERRGASSSSPNDTRSERSTSSRATIPCSLGQGDEHGCTQRVRRVIGRTTTQWSSGRALPASISCTGCGSWASRPASSRPPTTSAAPGTGTAIPAPAATSRPSTTRYSFDPELERAWTWSEKYATQPEILALPQLRRRPVRPASRHPTSAPRSRPPTWDDAQRAVAARTDNGASVSCRYYVMATGCLSMPKDAGHRRRRAVRGRGVLHQPLAARGRRLHRQARRGHRHWIVGHAVDPAHRRAGGAAHRVPAHAEFLAARP